MTRPDTFTTEEQQKPRVPSYLSRRWMLAGAVASILIATLLRAVQLWLPYSPLVGQLWQAGQLLLGVLSWIVIVAGAVLALRAVGVPMPTGTRPQLRARFVAGLAVAALVVYVLVAALVASARQTPEPITATSFGYFAVDAVLRFLESFTGIILAVALMGWLERHTARGDGEH